MQSSRLTLTLTTLTFIAFALVGMVKASPVKDFVTGAQTTEMNQQR